MSITDIIKLTQRFAEDDQKADGTDFTKEELEAVARELRILQVRCEDKIKSI